MTSLYLTPSSVFWNSYCCGNVVDITTQKHSVGRSGFFIVMLHGGHSSFFNVSGWCYDRSIDESSVLYIIQCCIFSTILCRILDNI